MKVPKKMGKRAQLWFQPGDGWRYLSAAGPRLRILYPSGHAQWISLVRGASAQSQFKTACYRSKGCSTFISGDVVQAMRKFDREQEFPRAKFLGYL